MTTHDWSSTIDPEHLAHVRADAPRTGAGEHPHLVLEVLADAHDAATAAGCVGQARLTWCADDHPSSPIGRPGSLPAI